MGKARCQLPVQPSLLPALSCTALSGSPECVSEGCPAPPPEMLSSSAGCGLEMGLVRGGASILPAGRPHPELAFTCLPFPPPQASGSLLLSAALPAFERGLQETQLPGLPCPRYPAAHTISLLGTGAKTPGL